MKKLFVLLVLLATFGALVLRQLTKSTPKAEAKASARSLTDYREVARKPSDF